MMGKITIGPANSSIKTTTYKPELVVIDNPVIPSLTAPIQQFIEVIKEVPFETIRYIEVPKEIHVLSEPVIKEVIVEKIIQADPIIKEVIVEKIIEKIVEVPNYDLYDGAVIQFDMLKRRHEKLKKQIKILIPIMAVVALIGYII
jgi:hypothetical protein